MQIEFLGAVRSVTGSMHLLHVNNSHILLECGIFHGHRQEAFERNRNLPFDARQIDALVLSHAHIDHSGNIPNLVKSGFEGNIYTTSASRDLCSIMLRDSGYIMEQDVAYLNRKRRRRHESPLEPIYTVQDAMDSLKYFVSISYERPIFIAPGVQLTFYDAGHILGSALCALDISEDGRDYRLLFTGDVGRKDLPILRDPQTVPDVDYLMIESTYGTRLHGTLEEADEFLAHTVRETSRRGGKIIIPAFSVGRTQEVVYALHRLSRAKKIPDIPIFVDSPLAINATEIFRLHPEYYDAETHAFMQKYRDPFGFDQLHYTRRASQSKALNTRHEPMVIISASGMCEAGRILHHLKNNVEDSRNTVLFVGFQAEHTLGRRILEGKKRARIFDQEYDVRAQVESITGYSAHADRAELSDYVRGLDPYGLQEAFVIHGEEDSALAFADALEELGVRKTRVPVRGEKATI